MKTRTAFLFSLAVLLTWSSVAFAGPMPGAVFTTDVHCNGTDLNIYADKGDVYIDGGPARPGAAGLPDGSYFVKVTEPDGVVLGNPPLDGDLNPIAEVHVTNGNFDQCYQLAAIVVSANTGDPGYDNTSNPGGEYKVWVSSVSTFDHDSTKTDNFKVLSNTCGGADLHVRKFYDANANGIDDDGIYINGWKVAVSDHVIDETHPWTDYVRWTPVDMTVDEGTYYINEFMPVQTNWRTTTTAPVTAVLACGDDTTVTFGNLCLGAGGGYTLGFWSNKNGQAAFNAIPNVITLLDALNLKDGAAADFDPNSYAQVRNWLLSGTAVNMAYMLSVQMATMDLNVWSGRVNPSSLIYAPGTNSANSLGYAMVGAVLNEANSALGANGSTFDGSPDRAYQEALKNALDRANNNLNFVQSSPCAFSFAQ